ncbi:MAG: hypothetical protein V7K27_00145 [Nostoc sp.]|uniref:hypothetical protein n=1 Tax=Nostoc sp. TaxID=1180 RepID=UPI002FF7EAFF
MTTTIRELLHNLKNYPLETVVNIQGADNAEFAIDDYKFSENELTIEIREKSDDDEDGEDGE